MPDRQRQVRLQPVTTFTVRILSHDCKRTVGTGFAVAPRGLIVTARHVAQKAVASGVDRTAAVVNLRFANLTPPETRVARWLLPTQAYDDDVAVLELTDGPSPLAANRLAQIGAARDVEGHEFRSYGYRERGKYPAGRARGVIMGDIEKPDGRRLLASPIELDSAQLDKGMSGAAVLDVTLNRVVGIVSEVWRPPSGLKDAGASFAVDAVVLTEFADEISLTDGPVPLTEGPNTSSYQPLARKLMVERPGFDLRHAPPSSRTFVGREAILAEIAESMADPGIRSVGVVGFGGEGKSALLRQAVEQARERGLVESALWWTFDASRGVEQFFDAALTHFCGGRGWERHASNPASQGELLGALLDVDRRHALVLDGLEILQTTDSDSYGDVADPHMRRFLQYSLVADGVVILGSRIQVMPLFDFTSYRFWELGGLTPAEGAQLLGALGVTGPAEEIEAVVRRWSGHALILTLLGGYLAAIGGGDVRRIADLPRVPADQPVYAHLERILLHYDRTLTSEARSALQLMSAFRTPVAEAMLAEVCRRLSEPPEDLWPSPSPGRLGEVMNWLRRLKMVRDPGEEGYSLHPLLRDHYRTQLQGTGALAYVHGAIADAYRSGARAAKAGTSPEQIAPALEFVHHACQAGRYEEAYELYGSCVDLGRGRLVYELGMYGVELDLMRGFFAEGNVRSEPLLPGGAPAADLLRRTGVALMTIGRLEDALSCDERSAAEALTEGDVLRAGRARQVAGEATLHLGQLSRALKTFASARELYGKTSRAASAVSLADEPWGVQNANLGARELTVCCLGYEAWIHHLRGGDAAACKVFDQAVALLREVDASFEGLVDLWGVYQADVLLAVGERGVAKSVVAANLSYAEDNNVTEVRSQARRQLGDLAMRDGEPITAGAHYAGALEIARRITHDAVLLEALTSRARWCGVSGYLDDAMALASEAIGLARTKSYRLYECDALLVSADLAYRAGDTGRGRLLSGHAFELALEMHYEPGRILSQELADGRTAED